LSSSLDLLGTVVQWAFRLGMGLVVLSFIFFIGPLCPRALLNFLKALRR
jgi:hypothetical protein